VAWGLFDEVVLSFLPVGHTHEDIDQVFSRLAVYLRKNNCRSRIELRKAFHECYMSKFGKRPITEDIECAGNISDWLLPYLHNTLQAVNRPGITNYHQFRLRRTTDGTNVALQVREWCTSGDPWRGLTNNTSEWVMFKEVPEPDAFDSVPPAQRKPDHGGTPESEKKFYDVIEKDVKGICEARDVPEEHRADLRASIRLLRDRKDMPFHWDTAIYSVHREQMLLAQAGACNLAAEPEEALVVHDPHPSKGPVLGLENAADKNSGRIVNAALNFTKGLYIICRVDPNDENCLPRTDKHGGPNDNFQICKLGGSVVLVDGFDAVWCRPYARAYTTADPSEDIYNHYETKESGKRKKGMTCVWYVCV
jgi:hypothetical protein